MLLPQVSHSLGKPVKNNNEKVVNNSSGKVAKNSSGKVVNRSSNRTSNRVTSNGGGNVVGCGDYSWYMVYNNARNNGNHYGWDNGDKNNQVWGHKDNRPDYDRNNGNLGWDWIYWGLGRNIR